MGKSYLYSSFLILSVLIKNALQGEVNPSPLSRVVEERLNLMEFEVNLNYGAKILEFSDEQDVFDIQLTSSQKNKAKKDDIGFCTAHPNMALFTESPGTYTHVYPDFFDKEGNLKNEDKVPPQLKAYARTNDNGLIVIDSEYNLIRVKVNPPNKSKNYHQPEIKSRLSFKEQRPNVQPDDYPHIATLIDHQKGVEEITFLFFSDQAIIYEHSTGQFRNATGWISVATIERVTIGYGNGDTSVGRPLLFVAAGLSGAQIYQIEKDLHLSPVQYLTPQFIKKDAQFKPDFTDVSHSCPDNFVYFLERNTGVHKVRVNVQTEKLATADYVQDFQLNFEGGERMRHHTHKDFHQAFISIIEEEGQKKVLEHSVNLDRNEWFLNSKRHYTDIKAKDVIVTANYAILLGDNVHKIVYHSIYKEFQTNQMNFVDKFSLSFIPGLVDSEFALDIDHKQDQVPKIFLIGITKRNIVFHQISRYYPSISCWPVYYKQLKGKQSIVGSSYYYDVTLLSRNCKAKDEINKYSDYIICNATMPIIVNITQNLIDSGSIIWIIVGVVFLGVTFAFCSIWGYCKYRITSQDRNQIEQEIKQLLEKAKRVGKGKKSKKQKYVGLQESNDETA